MVFHNFYERWIIYRALSSDTSISAKNKREREIKIRYLIIKIPSYLWLRIQAFFSTIYVSKYSMDIKTYCLWRTGKTILISCAWYRLICMSFDQISHRIMWTFTMHDLLCGIIWIHDVSPSDITEIFALS